MLSPLAKRMVNVNPNYLSIASLAFAFLAAALYALNWDWGLLLAAITIFVSGLLDALDGKVARISSKASKKGDFVDHVIDRYSDAVIIGVIGISVWCPPEFALFAIIGVMLTSYMGTQAQALGLGREYKGILGRADRLTLLIVVSLIQFVFVVTDPSWLDINDIFGYSLIAWMMLAFGVAGNITALQRVLTIWKSLP